MFWLDGAGCVGLSECVEIIRRPFLRIAPDRGAPQSAIQNFRRKLSYPDGIFLTVDALASRRGHRRPLLPAIRQAKAKTGTAEELARRIKEGAIPIISDVEGFMAYYVVYAPDDTVTAISLFNNFAGAEEANRRALAWIEQNLGPLLIGPASAVAGPVIVHTLA